MDLRRLTIPVAFIDAIKIMFALIKSKINKSLSASPKFVFLCIMKRDGAHQRILHRAMALVTTNFAQDMYAICKGGGGVNGRKGSAVARDRGENKTGGERCRARGAALFLRAGAPAHKKQIINQCAK